MGVDDDVPADLYQATVGDHGDVCSLRQIQWKIFYLTVNCIKQDKVNTQ